MGEESQDEVKEVLIGKGFGGALRYLRERGELKETIDWGGRNTDKKKSKLIGIIDESNNVIGQRDIFLDRVDEFGQMMTPKEAFQQFSHKFHGKEPGKKKQEKRQKQFKEEMKLKQMNGCSYTPLMTMDKIHNLQAKLQSPDIVLSGHINFGQTSNLKSGFTTVKKEPINSLIPMLSDNKIHFQGFKWHKLESRSMHPLPNKKPKLNIK